MVESWFLQRGVLVRSLLSGGELSYTLSLDALGTPLDLLGSRTMVDR